MDCQTCLRVVALALVGLLAACQDAGSARPGTVGPTDQPADPDQPTNPDAPLPDDGDVRAFACATPNTGCPCEVGQVAECHSDGLVEDDHGRLRCFVGARSCVDGVWGACAYDSSYELQRPSGRAFGDAPAACGNCDPECYEIGDDYSVDPGDLSANGTDIKWDGVAGGIVISGGGGGGGVAGEYAWIAFEGTSEVVKIRLSDGNTVGRFSVGEAAHTAWPSRTAVDSAGDVYIASRAIDADRHGFDGTGWQAYVTKIIGDSAACPDGGDGTIDTSTNDVAMALGTDDCVVWNVPVWGANGAHLRGVVVDRGDLAAPNGRPWVAGQQNPDGGSEPGRAYELNPDTGAVIQSVALPVHVYGAAIDAQNPQRIWFTTLVGNGTLVALNLQTLAIEGPYHPPAPDCTADRITYGIAIDGNGRIWRAGYNCTYSHSYDPSTGSWCFVNTGTGYHGVSVRVNDDGTNSVFMERRSNPTVLKYWDPDVACVPTNTNATYCNDWPDEAILTRFQRDNGCQGTVTEIRSVDIYPAASVITKNLAAAYTNGQGNGIAGDGRVIVNNRGTDNMAMYDPETDTTVTYPTTGGFGDPYSYSDFTGYQRAAFSGIPSTAEYWRDYGVADPACPGTSLPIWGDLTWTANVTNSHINFYVAVSNDPMTLDVAPRHLVGSDPPDASPLYVYDVIPLNERGSQYIRVIAELNSDDGVTSPVLQSMSLDWACDASI